MKSTLTGLMFAFSASFLMTSATPLLAQEQRSGADFESAAESLQQRLVDSMAELTQVREKIAAESIPLNRQISTLEAELTQIRQDYQEAARLVDNRTLDLNNLRNQIKARQEETAYLSTLMSEYLRNFESRIHISELQHHREALDAAALASDRRDLPQQELMATKLQVFEQSLERLEQLAGGARVAGHAVDAGGTVHNGRFLMVGPVVLFASDDGTQVGTIEQRLGSLEPTIVAFSQIEDQQAAHQAVIGGGRVFPLDATLGNARKIEATQETRWEHIKKGGPVMVPIFVLAGAALLVALYKWVSLSLIRSPSRAKVQALLAEVGRRDQPAAIQTAQKLRGPAGAMVLAGARHLHEPRELIEEVMYEVLLATRLRVQRFLPFVAISAAAAPLLGLLGTVTGIMTTFKLITVFGTGDVKTLSGGISEALITTEYGLIVAIPSLLLHAFLARKARALTDQMEQTAVAFLNQVSRTPKLPAEKAA